jgi:tRNA 2-thiouridine synthesizing protein A
MVNDPATNVEELDLRGLKCPLPALFAKRALLRRRSGVPLDVLADDPLAAVDIPHMCLQEAFELLLNRREGEFVRLRLRRPSAAAAEPPPDQDGQ